MFRRFLGTIFLYFYVIPAITRTVRNVIIPEMAKAATRELKAHEKRQKMERQFDKNNTPNWAREAQRQRR